MIQQVEISVKYAGYIDRQELEVQKFKKLERKNIPDHLISHPCQACASKPGKNLQNPTDNDWTGGKDFWGVASRHQHSYSLVKTFS